MSDSVNHPAHYTGGDIECIDAIKAACGERYEGYLQGNAMKYLWRVLWGSKGNDIQDLEKARWYVDREISRMKHALNKE